MKTALINIKTEKNLKDHARQVAKQIGLPLGTILNNYLRHLIDEPRVVFSAPLLPNKKTAALLKRASRDYRLGRNVVGPLRTATEMDNYLDS